jgi:RNA polymerase sigma-70 factor (ECF subfamily)
MAHDAMDDTLPVAVLLQQWQAGDARAAEALFERYARQLVPLAERHLSHKLAGRVDGEDVIQSVFRTFFRRSARGEFRIDGSAQIWRLLVKITVLKARAQGRRHRAARRDVAAEVAGGAAAGPEAVAHDPGPEEAVILVDQIESLLEGLPALHCHVLDLRLQGVAVTEVAARLGVARQTVYRVLQVLQQRLREQAGEGGDPAPESV